MARSCGGVTTVFCFASRYELHRGGLFFWVRPGMPWRALSHRIGNGDDARILRTVVDVPAKTLQVVTCATNHIQIVRTGRKTGSTHSAHRAHGRRIDGLRSTVRPGLPQTRQCGFRSLGLCNAPIVIFHSATDSQRESRTFRTYSPLFGQPADECVSNSKIIMP